MMSNTLVVYYSRKGANHPLLAFSKGYRQVTCTTNKHE